MLNFKIRITNGNNIMEVVAEDGAAISWGRRKEAGKLTFTVINDANLNFQEGNAVSAYIDNKGVFFGFVFTKKRSKNGKIEVTCYDQLRYFKNKDTYVYSGKTAGNMIQLIAKDYKLKTGAIADTKYKMTSAEDDQELFDIIQNALDETIAVTGKIYTMYDDFGKIVLKAVENMRSDYVVMAETAEDFSYESSIDKDVYNKIKLVYENEDTGKREIYIAQNTAKQNQWGVLQYYEKIQKGQNGVVTANTLIKLYGEKRRKLSVTGCFGDINIRPGTLVPVKLNLGDILVSNYMLVESANHKFSNNKHVMDLVLIGGNGFGT